MPPKPRPKAAATANSPASSWVARNSAIPAAWQAEPASTVFSPPMRSETQPQSCRLAKAATSSTDSIAAPCRALIPRSPQWATRCAAGMAIGTQHRNDAAASSACADAGTQPEHGRARGFRTGEGLRVGVGIGDEGEDRRLQLVGAGEGAAFEATAAQQREPALDEVRARTPRSG